MKHKETTNSQFKEIAFQTLEYLNIKSKLKFRNIQSIGYCEIIRRTNSNAITITLCKTLDYFSRLRARTKQREDFIISIVGKENTEISNYLFTTLHEIGHAVTEQEYIPNNNKYYNYLDTFDLSLDLAIIPQVIKDYHKLIHRNKLLEIYADNYAYVNFIDVYDYLELPRDRTKDVTDKEIYPIKIFNDSDYKFLNNYITANNNIEHYYDLLIDARKEIQYKFFLYLDMEKRLKEVYEVTDLSLEYLEESSRRLARERFVL